MSQLKKFANPEYNSKSWYVLGKSKDVKPGQKILKRMFNKQMVIFRGESGKLSVMDARCPHMGAMLGAGDVVGENIRCPFHFWEFDGTGVCKKVPYLDNPPKHAKVKSYPVKEEYGAIWFFYGDEPLYDLPQFNNGNDGLSPTVGPRRKLNFHHHLIYPNTVDFNHWWAVHGIIIDQSSDFTHPTNYQAEIELKGKLVEKPLTIPQKIFKFLGKKKFHWVASAYGGNVFIADMFLPIRM